MATARKKLESKAKKKSSKKNYSDSIANDDNYERLKDLCKMPDDFYTYFNEHIERARNFLSFLYVDQWDLTVRQAREAQSRPVMQFNKLVPIIRSVVGENRMNTSALTVRGVGDNVDQKTVDIYDGLIRQIQYDSNADIVYQIAGRQGLECGWGSNHVAIDYVSDDSFEQCLKIVPHMDFQCAFWDPTAQLPDKSDGDYCGVYTLMSRDKFKKLYPDIECPESASTLGDNYLIRWSSRDIVLICEIYYKEYFTKEIVQLSDDNVVDADEAKEIFEMQNQADATDEKGDSLVFEDFDALSEVNRRKVKSYKIKHTTFIETSVLEETDHPGMILPIPYWDGDSTIIDGERVPLPFVQDGVDQQRLINYIGSEMAYAILRARKETVMGTTKNFEGYEDDWRNPDQVQGALIYNFDKEAGKPEIVTPPVMNQMFLEIYQNCVRDLQENLGWFDEARGNETNAVSGKAIFSRQQASKKGVNLYNDNAAQAIRQNGKILIDLIPKIYDSERTVMIMGKDGVSKPITINKKKGFRMLPNGDMEPYIENDLSKGKYEVEIRVDGSYDAQQAEAMNVLLKLAQINPAIANLIPDLLAEVSGLENTQKLVDRLKTLLPPDILAKEEGKPMPPPQNSPPPPQLIIEQMKKEVAMAEDATKNRELAIKEQEINLNAQVAGIDSHTNLAKAAAEVHKSNIDKDVAILDHATTLHTNHHNREKLGK